MCTAKPRTEVQWRRVETRDKPGCRIGRKANIHGQKYINNIYFSTLGFAQNMAEWPGAKPRTPKFICF